MFHKRLHIDHRAKFNHVRYLFMIGPHADSLTNQGWIMCGCRNNNFDAVIWKVDLFFYIRFSRVRKRACAWFWYIALINVNIKTKSLVFRYFENHKEIAVINSIRELSWFHLPQQILLLVHCEEPKTKWKSRPAGLFGLVFQGIMQLCGNGLVSDTRIINHAFLAGPASLLSDLDGASLCSAETFRDLLNDFLAEFTIPQNLLIGVMTNIASDTCPGNFALTSSGLDCTTRDCHNKYNLTWS